MKSVIADHLDGMTMFIVYNMRGDVIRIISVKLATKGEIKHYLESKE